jgi:hypothetical protein
VTTSARKASAIAGLLIAVAPSPSSADERKPVEAPACTSIDSIGVATMADDGTIRMRLRSLPPGPIAEGEFVYKPEDRDYQSVIEHLGGLARGQSKPVKPWC